MARIETRLASALGALAAVAWLSAAAPVAAQADPGKPPPAAAEPAPPAADAPAPKEDAPKADAPPAEQDPAAAKKAAAAAKKQAAAERKKAEAERKKAEAERKKAEAAKKKAKKKGEAEAPEAPPAPAPLSDTLTGTAKAEYEAGKLLFQDGDAAGALVKFKVAYDESKDARLLWNMAACEKALRHYAKVEGLVARYLAEGGALLTEQDQADAKALLEAIQPFVGQLEIAVSEADAEVFVDDESLGRSPLAAPVKVDIGKRRVRVAKDGFKPFQADQDVTGGAPVKVEAKLALIVHEGKLKVTARPGQTIRVDGKVVGKGSWEATLASGSHTVRVTAPGMQPYDTSVVVEDEKTATVAATLERVPPPQKQPPREESGSGLGYWIAGGVAVVALGVAGFFVLQPEDEGPPPPVGGTIGTVELGLWR
ncbi:MAG: PEGA domain-containing protein [Polyangiaceae bacterium]|nr:PEGA domain-containing protein [Polyangiaceae bacterium]